MNNIRYYRLQKGLTQDELAKLLEVSRSAVAMWESGLASPRTTRLPQLAKVLGCDIEELY